MSASDSTKSQRGTLARTRSELRKLQSASMETTASQHGAATWEEEDLATRLAQDTHRK